MTEEPILIESIKRLDVRPGDTLILAISKPMSLQQLAELREQWVEQTQHLDVKAIVLGPGMEISVLTDEQRDELRRKFSEPHK